MTYVYRETFCLDKETKDFIEDTRWEFRKSKSAFARELFKFFINNKENLSEILKADDDSSKRQ